VLAHLQDLKEYEDSKERPYIHLLDGGLSDNLGMRGILEALDNLEALSYLGLPNPLNDVKRIIMFIVNSRSDPSTNWDRSEKPPGNVELLIKATGVPIDHYSSDTVETIRDTMAHWETLRRLRASPAFDASKDPAAEQLVRVPSIELYAIDVSFDALKDDAERAYLNDLPTSFVLPAEAVDRLRAAARKIVLESPEFKRLLHDAGASIVIRPPIATPAPATAN